MLINLSEVVGKAIYEAVVREEAKLRKKDVERIRGAIL